MKKYSLFLFVLIALLSCTPEETTTYYLIRHAEKVRTDATNRNPDLNEAGKKRAANWAGYLKILRWMPCILQIIIERYKLLPQQLRKKNSPFYSTIPERCIQKILLQQQKGKRS